jgi:ribosomal protein S18 acetylase RimI-like enzyme
VLQIGFCNDSGFGPILLKKQLTSRLAGGNMEKSHAAQGIAASLHEFAIRRARTEDAAAILQCLRAAFEPYRSQYTPQAWLDTVMTPDTLLHRLTSMTVLVAVSAEGNIAGTIGGAAVSSSEGHLRGMAVPPQWHGRGIAQRLLDAMEKHLLAKGCMRISLDTTEPLQRAMRFYEKNGFTRTGKISDFFGMPLIEYAKSFPLR